MRAKAGVRTRQGWPPMLGCGVGVAFCVSRGRDVTPGASPDPYDSRAKLNRVLFPGARSPVSGGTPGPCSEQAALFEHFFTIEVMGSDAHPVVWRVVFKGGKETGSRSTAPSGPNGGGRSVVKDRTFSGCTRY